MNRIRVWQAVMTAAITMLIAGVVVGVHGDAGHATTDPNDFTVESFHAEYELSLDGNDRTVLHTVETIAARFPDFDQNRGLQRAIPDRYHGESVGLSIVSVTDEQGAPRPYELSRDGNFRVITSAVPEGQFVHGLQTYVFEYTQENVARNFLDTGTLEWYWDVNGTDWWQPMDIVSASVTLDPALSEAFNGEVACYVGPHGSTQVCPTIDIAEEGSGADTRVHLTFEARDLADREGVTFAIGFTPGSFEALPVSEQSQSGNASLGTRTTDDRPKPLIWAAFGSAIAALVTSVWMLIRRIRGHRTGNAIIAQYDPPAGIPVAMAADLWNKPQSAMVATLLDLAVRGNIRLLRNSRNTFGAQFVHGDGTHPLERGLLRNIFRDAAGEWNTSPVWFTSANAKLSAAHSNLWKRAQSEVEGAGLRNPRSQGASRIPRSLLILAIVCLVAHVFMSGGAFPLSNVLPFGIFGGFVVFLVVNVMSTVTSRIRPLTREGALVHDHLAGLKDFIELAEADRIRMLQSASGAEVTEDDIVRLYERLLPYAALFGQEREWQRVLSSYYRGHAPAWIDHDGPEVSFPNLDHLSRAVAASVPQRSSSGVNWSSSSSSSSSSGGSSGGGFSGGGGGGGGGRGI